ncbi:MAG TPA: M28 family metallopeptidase [Vicinamibacterales bacterium]|nr:M28 family metallopeptidase [Vicinamibacterales bacterium]
MRILIGVGVLGLGLGLLAAARQPSGPAPLGFSPESAARHHRLERRFLDLPSAGRIDKALRHLADQPHMAGTRRDRELAEWTRDQFQAFGLEDVEITTHEVLLPWPEEVSVSLTEPVAWQASMREDPIEGDAYTHIDPALAGIPYHAYSASGEVVAPVVYAGSGNPADYDLLESQGIDIRGRIALVRYSVPYSYRGYKALTAQRRGLAGILIYSDPADDGFAKGKVYPDGPWGPESHIQRGGIVYDFMVPGDPLTPGWASVPGAKRTPAADAVSLPKIISAPLSYKDARVILEHIGGPEAPAAWKGALPIPYRMGGSGAVVRLRVKSDDRVRPIWTVTGRIRGAERPDDVVIVGNHRDAWIFGGVDPSSGSAALMELARTLGELVRGGWRPRRSILFASWDAEEFTLTSSTEWGEQHAERLGRNAVAYLNVDSAASGPRFSAAAVPALNQLIAEAAQLVRDPATRASIAAMARDRQSGEGGTLPTAGAGDLVSNRLGSGSDYTVFLNHLGVPIADLTFDGPYGVYHSMYDNYNWVARIGDPGFRYHVAMVQLWGVLTLRLADADVIPLDYEPYAQRIDEFAAEIAGTWNASHQPPEHVDLADVRDAAASLRSAAAAFNEARRSALTRGDRQRLDGLNARLMSVERALLEPGGIPGRPWYRHLVYAPKFTYAPELLPGVAEALAGGDRPLATRQATRLAAALRRAAEQLSP